MRTDQTAPATAPAAPASGPRRPASRVRLAARLGAAAVAGGVAAVALLASPASATAATGWIRFAHFSAANGPVTVTLDGTTLDADATFEGVSAYRSVAAGAHTLVLHDLGAPHTTLRDRVTVTPGGAVTVGAIAGGDGVKLESWTDDLAAGPAGDARVRIVDTAPSVGRAKVTFRPAAGGAATSGKTASATAASAAHHAGSTPARLASDVSGSLSVSAPAVTYGTASPYQDVKAGTYTVEVKGADGRRIITGKDWPVTAGTVDSVVVVQDGGKATLEVLRDAAGSSSAPVGGMETGYGGEAAALDGHHSSGPPLALELAAVAAVIGALGAGAFLLTRRPAGTGRRLAVSGTAAAAALVLCATACSSSGTRTAAAPTADRHGQSGRSAPAPAKAVTPRPVVGHGTTVNLAAASGGPVVAPTSLSIPSIGVDTSLVKLGRAADGAADVPTTTKVAGWYEDGPAPGQPGPAVILGHVDSYTGPGVFFRLHDLQPGALVHVGEGGRTLTFEVQQVETFSKASFPTAEVFGATPATALRLVTCGGPFDSTTGHYLDNVVVFTTEVGSQRG